MRLDPLDLGEAVSPAITARLYALRLAKYISDPSTVRARVIDECGDAPPIAEIAEMIAARPKRRAPEPDEIEMPIAAAPEPEPRAVIVLPRRGAIMRHERVIAAVEREFELTPGSICAPGRLPRVVRGRYVAIAVLRGVGMTCGQIGRWLGRRDHSTIVSSQARFRTHADDEMRALAERLIADWPTMMSRAELPPPGKAEAA